MQIIITRTPEGDIAVTFDEEAKAAHPAVRYDLLEDAQQRLLAVMADLEAEGLSGEPDCRESA